jgi:hypothetical protein
MKYLNLLLLLALATVTGGLAQAEEGMWTFNNFPTAKVKAAYGFEPSQAWLDNVRLSSARLAQGCSSSFVSPNGLVMTNHHCAQGCISQLSTKTEDLFATGFFAKTQQEERKCPALEVNQLVNISDVTDRVKASTKGLSGEAFSKARTAEIAKIEKECQGDDDSKGRCDVVSLYNGGIYNLYKYRRYQDVRLVFAPEFAIAFFGGDPDNFMFPRYDLDLTFFRIYENDKPVATNNYFKWSPNGAKEGELTFTSGHPGSTQRLLTVAQLKMMRDFSFPRQLMLYSEMRGYITQFQERGPEQKRISNDTLFGIENSIKAIKGEHEALLDEAFFATKVKEEEDFKARIMKNAKWRKEYGTLWTEQAALISRMRDFSMESGPLNNLMQMSPMFANSVRLIRAGMERPKPDSERLPGYNDSALASLRQRILSRAPVYKEFEVERLAFSLTKLRELLGADHPSVKAMLGKQSPRDLAKSAIEGSKIDNVDFRKKLFEGGSKEVDAAEDPLIALAKKFEPIQRGLIRRSEKELDPESTRIAEALAKARFDAYGTSIYPDATFSLRLSFGSVKGYQERGQEVRPFTIMGGAFERHTGAEPFALPQSWLDNKMNLDQTTQFNLVTTNDIIGGNSGSPLINKNAEIVGLIFDGNIQSLGGAFGFDGAVNRAVSVDSRAIVESLKKIYKTDRLLTELGVK